MDKRLLEILRCPVTHAVLGQLPREGLERLNERIREGRVAYADGTTVESPLTEGLVTKDGATVYRVDDEIPVMLSERGIPTGDGH